MKLPDNSSLLELVTLGGGWDWRFPGCMCEGMLGGMRAGVVCEDILFRTMSVLRSSNCTLGGWSVREGACEYVEDFAFGASLV